MEALLPQCLDSLTHSKSLLDRLDVVVVNDGSRDSSLSIAQSYAERFPQSVRVIDKPNGNYGSTINAALPTLTGEYVKILDADDCFAEQHLDNFLSALTLLCGVDMVVTPYTEVTADGEREVSPTLHKAMPYHPLQIYDVEQIFEQGVIRFFAMHGVAYRTALLRECGYRQSEGISYTDQEWVFYPLFRCRTIAFAETPIYRYNLAREGQTMNPAVQLRSINQLHAVTQAMAQAFAKADLYTMSEARTEFLRELLRMRMRVIYRLCLLDMGDREFAEFDFRGLDKSLTSIAEQCGLAEVPVRVNSKIPTDLLAHYRRTGHRHSRAYRRLLRLTDSVMMSLYRLL